MYIRISFTYYINKNSISRIKLKFKVRQETLAFPHTQQFVSVYVFI